MHDLHIAKLVRATNYQMHRTVDHHEQSRPMKIHDRDLCRFCGIALRSFHSEMECSLTQPCSICYGIISSHSHLLLSAELPTLQLTLFLSSHSFSDRDPSLILMVLIVACPTVCSFSLKTHIHEVVHTSLRLVSLWHT